MTSKPFSPLAGRAARISPPGPLHVPISLHRFLSAQLKTTSHHPTLPLSLLPQPSLLDPRNPPAHPPLSPWLWEHRPHWASWEDLWPGPFSMSSHSRESDPPLPVPLPHSFSHHQQGLRLVPSGVPSSCFLSPPAHWARDFAVTPDSTGLTESPSSLPASASQGSERQRNAPRPT